MKVIFILLLSFLFSCAHRPAAPVGPEVKITEVSPSKWTALTRQNLEHLLHVYDLAPFLFTTDIHIQSRVIPHSHPILTLNTRYAEKPHKLLSVFVHEQLHWWTSQKKVDVNKAIGELKRLFPNQVHSTYLHLIVCTLEYDAMVYFLNKKEATKIVHEFINVDRIYAWTYTQVLKRHKELSRIILKYKLKPKPLI